MPAKKRDDEFEAVELSTIQNKTLARHDSAESRDRDELKRLGKTPVLKVRQHCTFKKSLTNPVFQKMIHSYANNPLHRETSHSCPSSILAAQF